MKHEKAKVEKRKITGKKVKQLRKQGIVPANIYGKDFKSTSIQIPLDELKNIYHKVGETGIVEITLDKKTTPVLIHNIQSNPSTKEILHVDFMKINLKEKISTKVALDFVGEPQAVQDKKGLLMTPLTEVEIEALPQDLPEKIEVNVQSLKEVGDQITVEQIQAPNNTTILAEKTQVVANISELAEEEPEEPAPVEEGDEGTEVSEGEEAKDKDTQEEKQETDDSKDSSEEKQSEETK